MRVSLRNALPDLVCDVHDEVSRRPKAKPTKPLRNVLTSSSAKVKDKKNSDG